MTERLKVHAWKACVGNPYRGFESLSLRQESFLLKFPAAKLRGIFSAEYDFFLSSLANLAASCEECTR